MKSFFLFAVMILIVGGAYGIYKNINPKSMDKLESTEMVDSNQSPEESMTPKTDTTMMTKEGSYIPFTSDVLTDTASQRRVLFFYANWCSTCIPADVNISENISLIPADVALIRVNYNDTDTDQMEKDLAKQYGVNYQHTFVQIDVNGDEIAKWNGGQMDELLQNLK